MPPEFKEFAPIARLNRTIVVTEKIDGTNGLIYVDPEDGTVLAGSRSRFITPEQDNFGFAKWVQDHGDELSQVLGPGYHYGEWWGSGVSRRAYGLESGEKRFSLFNTHRWSETRPACCSVVPVLYTGPMSTEAIRDAMDGLKREGSRAAPGFMRPEGVVIFHAASNTLFKATLENDEAPKKSLEIR